MIGAITHCISEVISGNIMINLNKPTVHISDYTKCTFFVVSTVSLLPAIYAPSSWLYIWGSLLGMGAVFITLNVLMQCAIMRKFSPTLSFTSNALATVIFGILFSIFFDDNWKFNAGAYQDIFNIWLGTLIFSSLYLQILKIWYEFDDKHHPSSSGA